MLSKPKICFVASTGIPNFHRTNIEKLSEDFDIYAVMKIQNPEVFNGVKVVEAHSIEIERRPSIFKDIKALWELYRYFKTNKFDIFVSQSSKSSLLCAIAGRLAGVPIRVRIFTGQLWANKMGVGRFFFKCVDKLTVALNTHILVDGKPQRTYLIENGILKDDQATVLANGSICGVDVDKFHPEQKVHIELRNSMGLSDSDIVFAFMGRVNREKGIFELLQAFDILASKYSNIKLVLIGNSEGIDKESMSIYPNIRIGDNLILYGYTTEPYKTLQLADIFCLPSYREGFGMSAIEAASLELPVICSDAYGLGDSFVEGKTGLKCKVKDVKSLVAAMETYIQHPELIKQYGCNGRDRVVEMFNKDLVSNAWSEYFKERLHESKTQ